MRESMTPQQFAKWIAFRQIQPDRADRLIQIIKNGFALLANAWGAKVEPDDFDPVKADKPEASPNQAAQLAAMALGRPDGNGNR